MVSATSRRDHGDMTNLRTQQNPGRRSRGFASDLLYLIAVAVIFNATAFAAVAAASGLAPPAQAAIGVSVLAALAVGFSIATRGLRVARTPAGY
jgi:hypothetical protein